MEYFDLFLGNLDPVLDYFFLDLLHVGEKSSFWAVRILGNFFLGRQKWDIFGQLRPFLDTFSWYLKSDKDSVKTSIFHVAIFPP